MQVDENAKSSRQLHRKDIRSLRGGVTPLDVIINTNAVQKGRIIDSDDDISVAKPCETGQKDLAGRITSVSHRIVSPKPRGEKFLEQKCPRAAITPFPQKFS